MENTQDTDNLLQNERRELEFYLSSLVTAYVPNELQAREREALSKVSSTVQDHIRIGILNPDGSISEKYGGKPSTEHN
jgi:hypothetical protein